MTAGCFSGFLSRKQPESQSALKEAIPAVVSVEETKHDYARETVPAYIYNEPCCSDVPDLDIEKLKKDDALPAYHLSIRPSFNADVSCLLDLFSSSMGLTQLMMSLPTSPLYPFP